MNQDKGSLPTPQCVRRLQKELAALRREPDQVCTAAPSPDNILVWYFVVNGPTKTPYEGGRYVGRLNFQPDYPLQPPKVAMLTPSGRFSPGSAICLTISDFHPESWSPVWGVRTIVTGLLSFMVSSEDAQGSCNASESERKRLAAGSRRYNVEKLDVYKEALPEEHAKDLALLSA